MTLIVTGLAATSDGSDTLIVVIDAGPPSLQQSMVSTAIMMIVGTLIAVGVALLLHRLWPTGTLAGKSLVGACVPIAALFGLVALISRAAESSQFSFDVTAEGYAGLAATFVFAFLVARRVLIWRSDAR